MSIPTSQRLLGQTSNDLLMAADYIERNGHCKNALRNGEQACLSGAIATVCGVDLDSSDLGIGGLPFKRWVNGIVRVRTYLSENPVTWNSAPQRTGDEVIGVLRSAALMEAKCEEWK